MRLWLQAERASGRCRCGKRIAEGSLSRRLVCLEQERRAARRRRGILTAGRKRRGRRLIGSLGERRRAFECDVLRCPRCPGRLRFIATIESPEAIRRILTHLGLPFTLPRPLPARAPPGTTDDLFQEFPA